MCLPIRLLPLSPLEAFAGAFLSVLLALFHPVIAGQETSFLRSGLKERSIDTNARAMPILNAPACPERPPPTIFARQSYLSSVLVAWKGCLMIILSVSPDEIFLKRPFIHRYIPASRNQPDPGDSFLTPSGRGKNFCSLPHNSLFNLQINRLKQSIRMLIQRIHF